MIKFISHRGNLNGRIPERENQPSYIDEAIKAGYDCEIDLWIAGDDFETGHDEPNFLISAEWLVQRQKNLWIHCKNFEALNRCIQARLTCFYHASEDYTIINRPKDNLIWAHNLSDINSWCVIPLLDIEDAKDWEYKPVYGICSDYVEYCKFRFKND